MNNIEASRVISQQKVDFLEQYVDYGGVCEAYDRALRALLREDELAKELERCRNELCLYCGQYKNRHIGACDGCRWKEDFDG